MQAVNETRDLAEPAPFEDPTTPPADAKVASTTFTSVICSVIHDILSYAVAVIVLAYFLVQAMEAVSFVLGLHTGIVWKSCWVAYLFTTGLVAISFVLIRHDVFAGEGFERLRPGRA